MAEACECSPQLLGRLCERTLEKVRVRLSERGVDRATALMAIEVLSQGNSYHCSLDEELVSSDVR
jgi:hypothetical protein